MGCDKKLAGQHVAPLSVATDHRPTWRRGRKTHPATGPLPIFRPISLHALPAGLGMAFGHVRKALLWRFKLRLSVSDLYGMTQ